jgi:large subunit ribosomal protein L15
MELQSLKPAKGAVKKRKRIARGVGSGYGRTSTRGHKGAKSRSGYKSKRGFEGGQMPLQMRLPKVGFKSPNHKSYRTINLDRLGDIAEQLQVEKIDVATMVEHKIAKQHELVKILGGGELSKKLDVQAHAFSASAKQSIESAGGTVSVAE